MGRRFARLGAWGSAAVLALVLAAAVYGPERRSTSSDQIASAAAHFLSVLDSEARAKATYPLSDDERFNWHFIPKERNGLPLKQMTPGQRSAAHALLQATLSSQGYAKANAVIELERILGIMEDRTERRDPENYFFTVFGTPSSGQPWAWRFEGHHISLNFSSATGELVVTGPAFMGANPAAVPSGQKAGWRPLGREEDLARSLVRSLSPEQLRSAMIAEEAPRDIITGAEREARLERFEGLPMSRMTESQRTVLMQVVAEYVHNMEKESADAWMARIGTAIPPDRIYFAWAGSTEAGKGHYYRIHAPAFLIEYDNTQGNANHVHSVWRDLEHDFGGDRLGRHYEEADHHH